MKENDGGIFIVTVLRFLIPMREDIGHISRRSFFPFLLLEPSSSPWWPLLLLRALLIFSSARARSELRFEKTVRTGVNFEIVFPFSGVYNPSYDYLGNNTSLTNVLAGDLELLADLFQGCSLPSSMPKRILMKTPQKFSKIMLDTIHCISYSM
jgi:hypothetical protein